MILGAETMETTQTRRNFIKTLVGGTALAYTGCATAGRQNASLKQFVADYRAAKANRETPAETIKAYETALEQAFNDADLHLYVGFDQKNREFHKIPFIGKGEQYKDLFSLDNKVFLLERAYTAPMDKSTAPAEVLSRGRFVTDYKAVVPTLLDRAKGRFGDVYSPASHLDKEVWAALNDGKLQNGEVRGTPAHVLLYATHSGAVSLDTKVK
jgi:hypothetical protein